MAAPLERQLKAAQKFLQGVKSLPNFGEIQQKQFKELQVQARKATNLSTDVSGRLLETVSADLWGDLTNDVKSLLVDLTGSDDPNKDRCKNQNYLACVHYLSAGLVAQLDSNRNRLQVLEHVCSHLSKLGLRHPTEKTCGLILALVFDFHGVAYESDKWQYTQLHKATVQRLLNKPEPSVYCEELPTDTQQCPRDLFLLAFPDSTEPCALANPSEMILRGRTWPMRVSHRAAGQTTVPQATSAKPDFFAVGQMVAGIMSTGQPSRSALSGSSQMVTDTASAAKMKAPQLLALEDGSVEDKPDKDLELQTAEMKVDSVPQHPSGEKGVAASLSALRKDLFQDSPKEKIVKPLKRPAAAKAKKKAAKPKVTKVTQSKKMKRPAASMAAADAIPAETRRQWLVRSKVPLHLVDMWKKGCSRCYHRSYCTPSCWKRRGYTLL